MFHNRNYNKTYILRKTPSVLFKQMKKENTNNNNTTHVYHFASTAATSRSATIDSVAVMYCTS